MQTTEGFELVEGEGYCLWVGAGVSIHLSGVGGRPRTPNWSDLAKQMEEEAQLTPLNANLSFPDRFERMRRARGFEWFQSKLREKVLCRLSASVTEATSDLCRESRYPVSREGQQLAKLGRLANPVVNFNLETITSLAIARSGGPCSIKCFAHPKITELDANQVKRDDHGGISYRRHVYHPHGAIED